MIRRLVPLALLLALLAAGCYSSPSSTPTPPPPPPATTQPAAPPPPPATTAQASSGGNAEAGKAVFLSAGCTGCHTLAAVGATGTVGPSLDERKPSFDRVVDRVTNGKGAMPPFKGELTDQQIKDVAAFVSENAGK